MSPGKRRPGALLRRDTPVDALQRVDPDSAPTAGALAVRLARSALVRLHALETIESAYDTWLELRLARGAFEARIAEELRQLDDQGELLVGAAAQATGGTSSTDGLTPKDAGLADFMVQARDRLDAARGSVRGQAEEGGAALTASHEAVRVELTQRIERRLAQAPPRLRLMLRSLPGERRMLHAQRPEGLEAVLLHRVLTGRIPSRYGSLFDDSTDDLTLAPPTLYAEEGILPGQLRSPAPALKALLQGLPLVWPSKGVIPMPLPPLEGRVLFARWLSRGPVLEAELEDADGWRGLLSKHEAERITGALLALKLGGQLELELVPG